MARRGTTQPTPVWRMIVVQIAQWGAVAGVLVALALVVAGEARPPQVLQRDVSAQASPERSPFSLTALHERLPPEAVIRVQRYVEYFQTESRRRLVDGLSRSTRYLDRFREIFRKQGLPEELAYLPLIESGFVETAVSPAAAVGMWQFIEDTGRRYNLQRTAYTDQRLDPFQSAHAAARLLKHLYATFDNWELALAAYNAGAGTVKWALRVNRRAGKAQNFWALDLPEETVDYVPTFLAAVLIAKNPQAFGITEIRFHPQLAYEVIKVTPGTRLHELAEQMGVSLQSLWDLNPNLIRGVVPPGDKPYALRIPRGLRQQVPERLAASRKGLRDWLLHRVADTDTVELLAQRWQANSGQIKQINRLDTDEELSQREFIIIPL